MFLFDLGTWPRAMFREGLLGGLEAVEGGGAEDGSGNLPGEVRQHEKCRSGDLWVSARQSEAVGLCIRQLTACLSSFMPSSSFQPCCRPGRTGCDLGAPGLSCVTG